MLTHAFGQKMPIFLCFFWVKTRLEIRFNNVLDREEFFLSIKTKFFKFPKIAFFQKWLTHAFGQKMPNFSLFGFG